MFVCMYVYAYVHLVAVFNLYIHMHTLKLTYGASKQLLCSLNGEFLTSVHVLTAAVISLCGVAFRILICENGSLVYVRVWFSASQPYEVLY